MIDSTLNNINRLFKQSFKDGSNDFPEINSFDKYFMALVEIKDFNLLINNKLFFE